MKGEIVYKGAIFPFRNISIDDNDVEVTISTNELNSILINDKGGYDSEDARFIDKQIYFFVDKEVMDLPGEELVNFLKKIIQ